MCVPVVAAIGGALLMRQMMKQRQGPAPKAAPIEKPLPTVDDAPAPEEIKDPTKEAAIKKPTKRAQLGLNPDSTPGDLKLGGISTGVPDPGGRQSPTGVVAP